ncbi:hypothetical protein LDVICp026 [lymphocystis disease virus-China]|uniref:Uncharacterized protein n=1 Tax=lymphocystis disease virus-China TaxID=256729 RepID=Q678I3_9VIRU|nr:hypothetical protein LDVICp026 [lymphocystis disease virus-China]AAU10874.1 hypothetical protein [lymphocystis disease virus-China]
MWVNNKIRHYTIFSKRHIFLTINHTTCAFLSSKRSKLITYFRYFRRS